MFTREKEEKRKRLNRGLAGDIVVIFFLAVFSAFSALPLVYAAVSAFKPLGELFIFPPRFFVSEPTWGNFVSLFQLTSNMWVPFIRYLYNSLFITAAGTLGQMVIASLAAYPLAKHIFPGRKTLNAIVIVGLLFSTTSVTAVPLYIILTQLRMINTHWALVMPAMQRTLGLFLLTSFMSQIPTEMLEASRIDGSGELKTLVKVVMPNVKPAVMTMFIFCFQELWRESGGGYLYNETLKTLPAAFSQISTSSIARAGMGSAIALLMMIPPILIFFFCQQRVMETMAHSGIKG